MKMRAQQGLPQIPSCIQNMRFSYLYLYLITDDFKYLYLFDIFGKYFSTTMSHLHASESPKFGQDLQICTEHEMGQVTKVRLSCYLVLLSTDSKTR